MLLPRRLALPRSTVALGRFVHRKCNSHKGKHAGKAPSVKSALDWDLVGAKRGNLADRIPSPSPCKTPASPTRLSRAFRFHKFLLLSFVAKIGTNPIGEDKYSSLWEHGHQRGGGGKTSSCLNCNLLCNPERIRALPVYKALSQSGPLSCLDLGA